MVHTVRCCWEHVQEHMLGALEHINRNPNSPFPPSKVHVIGLPHWLQRISMPISVLYEFWPSLIAGAQIVGYTVHHPIHASH